MGSSSSSSWLRGIARSPPIRGQQSPQDVELTQHCRAAHQQQVINVGRAGQSVGASGLDTEPVAIQQSRQATTLTRCASSGSGLPSALGTPPSPRHAMSGHSMNACKEEEQQQQQDTSESSSGAFLSTRQQKGVRWLPDLHAPPAQSSPALPARAPGNDTQGLQPAGGSSGNRHTLPSTAGANAAAAVAASSSNDLSMSATDGDGDKRISTSRGGPLPPTDDQQLDKYLRYLLQQQHPHKFMYYPGWGLTEASCAAIGEFLRRDKRIKVVTLSGNSITDDGVELLAEGLVHNSCLVSLDLSDNLISSVGAIELAEALHSDSCRVAELLLRNNRIGDEGADALAAAAASSSCLKKLNLSGNLITSAQMDVVQHVLKTREYKVSALRQPSKDKKHLRKCSSGLQFDIELIEGQARSKSSHALLSRQDLMRLPPSLAVAALIEPKDPLECSIGMQAAHLLAELHEQARQSSTAAGATDGGAAPATEAAEQAAGHGSTQHSLTVMLAHRLACRGYDVVLRTCFPVVGIDPAKDTHKHHHQQQQQQESLAPDMLATGLRHTFVRVSQPMPAEEAVVLPTIIVDPLFRDEFEMPHATARFTSVLDALPRVLCLAEARLWHLAQLLCSETAAAFKDCGLSLPPWRHTGPVMDMWLSPRFHDCSVDADSSVHELDKAVLSASVA